MSFVLCRYFERSAQVFKIPLYKVLDVGASNGDWVKLVKEHYPDVKFTMVEPNPIYQEELKKLGEVHDVYLSDLSKTKKFYVAEDLEQQSGNTFYPERSNVPFSSIAVETRTLDHLFADRQFDLIKIDTQGAECEIMDGGRNLISKAKWLQLEVPVFYYNEGGSSFKQIIDKAYEFGFEVFEVEQVFFNKRCLYIDFIFVNKNLEKHPAENTKIMFTKYKKKT